MLPCQLPGRPRLACTTLVISTHGSTHVHPLSLSLSIFHIWPHLPELLGPLELVLDCEPILALDWAQVRALLELRPEHWNGFGLESWLRLEIGTKFQPLSYMATFGLLIRIYLVPWSNYVWTFKYFMCPHLHGMEDLCGIIRLISAPVKIYGTFY